MKRHPARGWLVTLCACALLQGCGGGDESSAGNETAPAALEVFPADAGAPGDVVLVQGEGFGEDCRVSVSMEGQPLADARSAGGGFAVQAVIPEGAARGVHTVTARTAGGSACNRAADGVAIPLAVTEPRPVINLAGAEGRPGGVVAVAGRGFCSAAACSPVTVLMNGFVAADDVPVEADGTFLADALVPAVEAAGAIVVAAVQTSESGDPLRAFGDIVVTVKPDFREVPQ